jgi:hypothetical protein
MNPRSTPSPRRPPVAAGGPPPPSQRALRRPLSPPITPTPTPQEVNELKATVEKSKNDVIKTVIGVLGTFSAIAFTISRLVTMS